MTHEEIYNVLYLRADQFKCLKKARRDITELHDVCRGLAFEIEGYKDHTLWKKVRELAATLPEPVFK